MYEKDYHVTRKMAFWYPLLKKYTFEYRKKCIDKHIGYSGGVFVGISRESGILVFSASVHVWMNSRFRVYVEYHGRGDNVFLNISKQIMSIFNIRS